MLMLGFPTRKQIAFLAIMDVDSSAASKPVPGLQRRCATRESSSMNAGDVGEQMSSSDNRATEQLTYRQHSVKNKVRFFAICTEPSLDTLVCEHAGLH